jgi:iron complex outermembrane receptor protein
VIARYRAVPWLDLAFGGEVFQDRLRSNSLGDREEERTALFAEANAGQIGKGTLALGLRSDWHSAFGNFIAPSAAAAVWPAEEIRLRASVGRAFRAPTWTERYYLDPSNIGDPNLDPERAWEAEVGVDLALAATSQIGIAAFHRSATGLIDWGRAIDAELTDPWYTRNVSNARFQGVEIDATTVDPLGIRWNAALATISLRAEDVQGLTSRYALRPLTRTASLSAAREIGAGLSVMLRGYHARRLGEEAYLRTDMRVGYDHGPVRVHLDLLNLNDVEHLDLSGLKAPGRALYLGASWQYAGR